MNLRQGRVLRIGHRGAAALAPENSLASIEAAIDLGVDLVEVDVVFAGGALSLAHGSGALSSTSPTLAEALELLAASETGVLLDLKSIGAEREVVAAIRAAGLLDRAAVGSFHAASLRALKELEPSLTTGFSYPFDRVGLSTRRAAQPLISAGLAGLRHLLPARISRMLARARADAAMLHWTLVSRRLVERCHASGAAVLAWTIEEDAALRRALAAGVDGVIADDPRLLSDVSA
jgi:glycerophosphoryl diester phosphodiesterase